MSQYSTRSSNVNNVGLLQQMGRAIRLLFDPRVPASLKLMLPVAAALYWFWPIDLMPGLPFDDVAILIGALMLFAKLASEALERHQRQARETSTQKEEDGTVIDTTWRIIE